MTELKADGEPVGGGLPLPSLDEVTIRSQNARRLGRRRQAAALAFQVQQTSAEDLDRAGDTRVVGGRFESLQEVPERERPEGGGLDLEDLFKFLETLNFPRRRIPG